MSKAKYLENCISNNDLYAFYCEDKEDSRFQCFRLFPRLNSLLLSVNNFMSVCRDEKRWVINAVHAPSSHQHVTMEYPPKLPLSELRFNILIFARDNVLNKTNFYREWGFYTYVRELINAPEPIVRFLCKNYHFHNIPVGNEKTFENFGAIRDRFGSFFSTFYGGIVSLHLATFSLLLMLRTRGQVDIYKGFEIQLKQNHVNIECAPVESSWPINRRASISESAP